MNYSINRLTKVVSSYIRRNLLPNITREFIILDITDSKIGRITNDTEENSIKSILGNDFREVCGNCVKTVEVYLNLPNDYVIMDNGTKKESFTYFWGIYKNKLLCGKLEDLPKDMEVVPVRNLKKIHGRVVDTLVKPKEKISLYFIDEFGNELQYPQTGNVTKTILVGEKHQLFLSCNPCWDMREYSKEINKYLINNPSYFIQLDNGRYENYQFDIIDKEKYIETGFIDYDDMFVIGEIK